MLEAAIQLLEEDELHALTTNAVAARAGVSIGTLYQYFGDKQALLDALVERELGAMSGNVVAALKGEVPAAPGERLRAVVRAVVGAYGGRTRVHRRLIEHALATTGGRRLSPLFAQLVELLSAEGVSPAGKPQAQRQKLSRAQAFVLTNAVAGVLRTLAASASAPPLREIEDELVRLVVGYMQTATT